MKKSKFIKSLLITSPLLVLVACSDAPQDKAPAAPEETAVMSEKKAEAPMVAEAPKADKAAYEKALADANAALDKAASVGGEWRDARWKKSGFVKWTNPAGEKVKGSFVGVAEMAAEAGDYAKAIELLEMAKFQGEMGYQQAMEQQNAGPAFGPSAESAKEMASYDELLKATIAAADKAASVGGEWRDTRWKKSTFVKWTKPDGSTVKGSFVGVAEEAAAAGDYKKAISLLEMAKFQAEMGYQQAIEQQNAGPKL